MTISTAGVMFEGRNVDIQPEWYDAAAKHLARLITLYGTSLSARISCIRKRSGHRARFELQLVLRRGARTVAVMQQGEDVLELMSEAFESAQREMDLFVNARAAAPRNGHVFFGRIRWVDARASCGFIDGGEAGEVHFTRDMVRGGEMAVGAAVSFALQADEAAPTAAWVAILRG